MSKGKIPADLKPMLASLTDEPFNNEEWIYEVKWDGYRVLAFIENGKVVLRSRESLNYTQRYPLISESLAEIKHDAVLDGEIMVLDENGRPDFNTLQRYDGRQPLVYYAFDLLWLDGEELLSLPLIERKEKLQKMLPENNVLHYSEHFDDGIALFEQASSLGLEGVLAKKKDSSYQPGKRTRNWLKIKANQRQEFVIGGWTESGNNQPFRSLIFGNYENGKLKYVHHAGGGFTFKEKKELLAQLKTLEIKKSPFVNKVEVEQPVHWVQPVLVGEFEISAKKTINGLIRHPAIFKGLRSDKKPEDVVPESQVKNPPDESLHKAEGTTKRKPSVNVKKKRLPTTEDSNWPQIESKKITSEDVFEVDGKRLRLTNVEKELWRGVTRADLFQYYHQLSPVILPHVKDRPLSLHIKLISPHAPGFYIKDMEGRQPEWSTIFSVKRKHFKKGKRDIIDYLVCNEEATLLFVAELGCIDINPWTSTIHSPDNPDFIIIDLDPSDNDFSKSIDAALASKMVFDKYKITSFIKTSGKTGIHLFLPCDGFGFKEARTIAEHICEEVHVMLPDTTTTAVSINQRGDKLYLDPNQNDEADTVASVYSLRPYHLPTVSTPLEWKEVKPSLDPHKFTIATVPDRVKKKGDIFKEVLNKKIAVKNSKALRRFL